MTEISVDLFQTYNCKIYTKFDTKSALQHTITLYYTIKSLSLGDFNDTLSMKHYALLKEIR